MDATVKKTVETVGIYGGTFSPPHRGHRKAAETFLEAIRPDKLLVIPTFLPPHKEVSPADSPEHRLAMTRLAFAGLENTEVSDMEIRRRGRSYTYDTLTELSREGRELYFLCGTDMLLTVDTWYRAADLFRLCTFVLERRECDRSLDGAVNEKIEAYRRDFGARILVIDIDPILLSSTDVRNAARRGASLDELSALVDDSVAAYIDAHGLYREDGGAGA